MTQGALVFHGTSACTGRPFDGWIMYTDIDFENMHLSATFNLTLNWSRILTRARRSDQYCSA